MHRRKLQQFGTPANQVRRNPLPIEMNTILSDMLTASTREQLYVDILKFLGGPGTYKENLITLKKHPELIDQAAAKLGIKVKAEQIRKEIKILADKIAKAQIYHQFVDLQSLLDDLPGSTQRIADHFRNIFDRLDHADRQSLAARITASIHQFATEHGYFHLPRMLKEYFPDAANVHALIFVIQRALSDKNPLQVLRNFNEMFHTLNEKDKATVLETIRRSAYHNHMHMENESIAAISKHADTHNLPEIITTEVLKTLNRKGSFYRQDELNHILYPADTASKKDKAAAVDQTERPAVESKPYGHNIGATIKLSSMFLKSWMASANQSAEKETVCLKDVKLVATLNEKWEPVHLPVVLSSLKETDSYHVEIINDNHEIKSFSTYPEPARFVVRQHDAELPSERFVQVKARVINHMPKKNGPQQFQITLPGSKTLLTYVCHTDGNDTVSIVDCDNTNMLRVGRGIHQGNAEDIYVTGAIYALLQKSFASETPEIPSLQFFQVDTLYSTELEASQNEDTLFCIQVAGRGDILKLIDALENTFAHCKGMVIHPDGPSRFTGAVFKFTPMGPAQCYFANHPHIMQANAAHASPSAENKKLLLDEMSQILSKVIDANKFPALENNDVCVVSSFDRIMELLTEFSRHYQLLTAEEKETVTKAIIDSISKLNIFELMLTGILSFPTAINQVETFPVTVQEAISRDFANTDYWFWNKGNTDRKAKTLELLSERVQLYTHLTRQNPTSGPSL